MLQLASYRHLDREIVAEEVLRADCREGEGCAHVMHDRCRMTIDPAGCRDRARRVFTDQADIACTKREAPSGVWRVV